MSCVCLFHQCLLRASLPHPQSDLQYSSYTVGEELVPGLDLFSEPDRGHLGTTVSSLAFLCHWLYTSGHHLTVHTQTASEMSPYSLFSALLFGQSPMWQCILLFHFELTKHLTREFSRRLKKVSYWFQCLCVLLLQALPMLALYLHFVGTVCRDPHLTIKGRILKVGMNISVTCDSTVSTVYVCVCAH